MINDQQIKDIINSPQISDINSLEIIQRYIFDMKGIEVSINRPNNMLQLQLMNIGFEVACNFYGPKLN